MYLDTSTFTSQIMSLQYFKTKTSLLSYLFNVLSHTVTPRTKTNYWVRSVTHIEYKMNNNNHGQKS